MKPRWVRWTVIAIALLMAAAFALSAVPSRAQAHPAVPAPPVNAPADYQLGAAYRPADAVRVVTRDRDARPAGRYDVCYVNAFQTQPGELRWWQRHHPRLLLRVGGRPLRDAGWPDEVLLDTRTADRRSELGGVLGRWAARCAAAGDEGLEPDNLDSWTRSRHRLTRVDNLAVARLLVRSGHRAGLAVAQKNTAELTGAEVRRTGFDFAVAEDCEVYAECDAYRRLYGAHVIEVEYADQGRAGYRRACAARGDVWSILYRDRDLRAPGQRGYLRSGC
ncbi:MAG: endo alpha-1,4 polygalactosaminidase [Nocardioidaceae bacterium]